MTGGYTALMAVLLACHCAGDFSPLSTARMLEAKRSATGHGWILAHAGVHAILVAVAVAVLAGPGLSIIAAAFVLELGTHFVIDAVRARIGVRSPRYADPDSRSFWYLFGVDQLAHGLVLVVIAGLASGV